jgi:hypothetical protein
MLNCMQPRSVIRSTHVFKITGGLLKSPISSSVEQLTVKASWIKEKPKRRRLCVQSVENTRVANANKNIMGKEIVIRK